MKTKTLAFAFGCHSVRCRGDNTENGDKIAFRRALRVHRRYQFDVELLCGKKMMCHSLSMRTSQRIGGDAQTLAFVAIAPALICNFSLRHALIANSGRAALDSLIALNGERKQLSGSLFR